MVSNPSLGASSWGVLQQAGRLARLAAVRQSWPRMDVYECGSLVDAEGALKEWSEQRMSTGKESIPDELVAYHLRKVGGDQLLDPVLVRYVAANVTALVQGFKAKREEPVPVLEEPSVAEEEDAKRRARQGYWIKNQFICTGAKRLTHVVDVRGENWVAWFDTIVQLPTGEHKKSTWYDCTTHGCEETHALASRHLQGRKRKLQEDEADPRRSNRSDEAGAHAATSRLYADVGSDSESSSSTCWEGVEPSGTAFTVKHFCQHVYTSAVEQPGND